MIKFTLTFALSFSIALFAIDSTNGVIAPVFKELLTVFFYIALLAGTLSFALHGYLDSIIKDVASDKVDLDPDKYQTAITKLSALKREVLINACAIAVLLIIERITLGISIMVSPGQGAPYTLLWALSVSVRVACFATSVLLAGVQFHGFLIANDFRTTISRQQQP